MLKLLKNTLLVSGSMLAATPAMAAIDVNTSFTPATRYPGEDSRLILTLQNSSLDPTTNVEIQNILPNDVFISTNPNLVNNCGGTATATNGATSGQLSLVGGIIPAGDGTNPGSCTVEVNVNSQVKGTYINVVPVGGLTGVTAGLNESNATASQATLAVILQDLNVTFTTDNPYIQGYETTIRRITVSNPNPVPLTNLSFVHDLYPDGYVVRIREDLPMGSDCGANLVVGARPARNADWGPTSDLTVTGGSIPANGSCEIFYTAEPARDEERSYRGGSLNNRIPAASITTNEGATNLQDITSNIRAYTGAVVYKYFNGSSSTSTMNINSGDTALLRLNFRNYNTQAITNVDLTDVLPAGMTVQSIDSNSCAGTVTNSPNSELTLSGGTIPAAGANLSGLQTAQCDIYATVQVAAAGTYNNDIPTAVYNGSQEIRGDNATLIVNGSFLSINKAFIRNGAIYAGDSVNLNFTITNLSNTIPVTNLTIPDDLTTMVEGFRVGPLGLTSNSCGGTGTVVPDATDFVLSGMSVDPGETCTFSVQLMTASDMVRFTTGSNIRRTNTIPVGDITFDTPTNTDVVFNQVVSREARVYYPVLLSKVFTPDEVGPLGISRLRVNVRRFSSDRIGIENMSVLDNLPTGHEVAPNPNIFNGCGGTLNAAPGSNSVHLTGAGIAMTPTGSSQASCYFEVDIRAPGLTPGLNEETATNIIPGDNPAAGAPVYFIANDVRQSAPYNRVWNRRSALDILTRRAAAVTMSKEFLPATINGGGQSRVRITFSNTDSTAIDLTGVGLIDDFSATDMRLYSNIDPTFTDNSGNPNANGCYGGVFGGSSGGNQFSLSDARIDQFAICRLEFNVSAFQGGNHINRIPAGSLTSNEGVTNPAEVSATLTVGYQIGVGKGFNPPVIEAGAQSTLTLDIYNTNVGGNDQIGASPAIIDTMPAGLQVVPGTASTTCAGGSASSGVDGGGNSFLRLDGGTFPASDVCQVTAQVTSAVAGSYLNQIPVGALRSDSGSQSPDPAEATLRVIQSPTIAKVFGPNAIAAGSNSTITFTISNPNSAAALPAGMNGISFSDVLSNMTVAAPLNLGGTCAGYSTNATIGATSFNVSNISLGPSASCTVTVPVTSNVFGQHDNQTSGLSSNQTVAPGAPSNIAQLSVLQPLTLSKSFGESAVQPGSPVRMTFSVTNPNSISTGISNPGFTDVFPIVPGAMTVAPVPNLSNTCPSTFVRNLSNTANVAANDTGVLIRNGSVPASSSCEISLDVVLAVGGSYTNTTSVLNSAGGQSPAASANIFGISITATDDTATGINGVSGASGVLNVFAGDAIVADPAATTNSTLSVATGSSVPTGLTFDTSSGDVDVDADTPAGTYTFDYQICETANPLNCTTATASVTVAASADFSITKTNTPGVNGEVDQADDSVITGTNSTYTIVVTNNGPDTVDGALVKDTVVAGLTCVAGDAVTIAGEGVPAGSFTIGDLTGAGITLGELQDGQSTTISYTCEVN